MTRPVASWVKEDIVRKPAYMAIIVIMIISCSLINDDQKSSVLKNLSIIKYLKYLHSSGTICSLKKPQSRVGVRSDGRRVGLSSRSPSTRDNLKSTTNINTSNTHVHRHPSYITYIHSTHITEANTYL